MESIWDFFIRKKGFSYLLIIAIIAFGLYTVVIIPKESAPEIQVPVAIVTTIFPGASAVDVERLVTNKIESGLQNLSNLSKVTSNSGEGFSSVVVEFDASADVEESIREVRDEVDRIKNELPSDTEDPVVSEVDFVNQPIQSISISSDLPAPEFIALIDRVSDELEQVSGVSSVTVSGIPEREVQVIVSKEKLLTFGLSLNEVTQAIASSNSSVPIGNIESGGINYSVEFKGKISSTSEVQNIVIKTVRGEPVYVKDVAQVSDGVSESKTFSRISINGSPSRQAATLSIFKQSGGDITRIADRVLIKIDSLKESVLQDEEVLVFFDTGDYVKKDLKNLSATAFQAILLVMVVLLIALGWREALIAGFAIPMSFLLGFIGLYYSGNTINFISLFSLILAVGILVDSAIVITEAVHSRLKEHSDRTKAAKETVHEFHWPLTSGTMTTIAVFAPLFLISGVTGEFISSIPFTLIFVLLASLFVALAIVPIVSSKFLNENADSKFNDKRDKYTQKLTNWYRGKLGSLVNNRDKQKKFFRIMAALFVISIALVFTGIVEVIFFPQEDIEYIYIEVEEEIGTPLLNTDLAIRSVEEYLYDEEDIESFVTTVGAGSMFGSGSSGSNIANVTIVLKDDRKQSSSDIVRHIQDEVDALRGFDVRVSEPNDGPPVGKPIVIKFFGDDLDTLSEVSKTAKSVLSEVGGAEGIVSSASEDITQFSLYVKKEELSRVGLTPVSLAGTIRTSIQGTTATVIKNSEGDIDVVVKLDVNSDYVRPEETDTISIDDIRQLQVNTPSGVVLVGSVVDVNTERSNINISHEDGRRLVSVSADLASGYNANKVLASFRENMTDLPDGVEMSIGGESEETNTAFREMGLSLIAGIILVIAILVLQFNSYRQVLFIVIIIPLSLIGVLFGLAIFDKALSFPSLMGFIALSGIVVNNAIILIDVINSLRKESPKKYINKAIIDGAVSRLRPILLTTLTTVIGMIPLTYASDLWSPLAFAVIFGLAFSSVVTLFLIPILYSRWPGV
ncbi:MAG: efflux RND transporter permease subunit [Candidatus Pacebacteria bacterium]|nr:efflux RND transporter permease subunit [Candidatus Paceibacterota bacterium]